MQVSVLIHVGKAEDTTAQVSATCAGTSSAQYVEISSTVATGATRQVSLIDRVGIINT